MKKYIIEMQRGLKWKKTWWTVPKGTCPFPVRVPAVSKSQANKELHRVRKMFPLVEYRISESVEE